ncbi:hypothetical protein [Hymenobacter norwichensis]|uniref:hypothetical protein n=1 Tax=Hymenobacter norwichensis TaxID=223903 RepID=UPI0003B5BCAC|nr:hypothetical protein [Hymenobacter norwichensis]
MKRILFLFGKEDGERINDLDAFFFPLSVLFQNLINEYYSKNKLNEIIIRFYPENYYRNFPIVPQGQYQHTKGYYSYYDTIDLDLLSSFDKTSKYVYLWRRACSIMKGGAGRIDDELPAVIDNVLERGLALNLNPDFNLIEKRFYVKGSEYKVYLRIHFNEFTMDSLFCIEYNDKLLLNMQLEEAANGAGFFLVMYKNILLDSENKNFVLTGSKEVDYLPLRVRIPDLVSS